MNDYKSNVFSTTENHRYLGKQNYELLTWEDVIHNFDVNISSNKIIDILPGFTLITVDVYENQKVISILEDLSLENPKNICTAHLYVSLSKNSSTFGKHKDNVDVWYWQCLGITRWTVYDEKEYVYDLSPGDMIYVPREMYHSTEPITPRAGVSFGIN